jgi:hypothetical protein
MWVVSAVKTSYNKKNAAATGQEVIAEGASSACAHTGCLKKIWTVKTRSREKYHITTDEIWRTIHSNTSEVYLERAKLLHNTTARWQAD